jgi:hypothetical protein
MKPTLGPWEFTAKLSASENHKGFFVRAEKATRNGKWALAEVQPGDEDGKLGEANARLIAAAPDLLEACKACLWALEAFQLEGIHAMPNHPMAPIKLAREAVEKAVGQLPQLGSETK